MHLTISGKPGIVRDYFIVKSANKNNVKTIVHCHFGSVWNQVSDTGFGGNFCAQHFRWLIKCGFLIKNPMTQ